MRHCGFVLALALAACAPVADTPPPPAPTAAAIDPACGNAGEAALAVTRAYIDTFNARDAQAWLATMHFPHVRHADGKLALDAAPDPVAAAAIFPAMEAGMGWASTSLDSAEVIQCAAEKVHVAVRVTRKRADGSPIHSFNSFYVITPQDGRWAIAMRSSYAPEPLPEREN